MRAAAILLVGASACVEHRVLEVPIDDYTFEYGFMVLRDEAGATTRISEPFGVADGALTFGSPPAFDLREQEHEMMLVALPAGALREQVPLFDQARAERLELLKIAEGILPFYESQGGDYLTVPLPQRAMVLRGDFENPLEDAADPGLPLRVPIAPEECKRMDPSGFVPFGRNASIIPGDDGANMENFHGVALIDEERLLGSTIANLHLFRAGELFVPVDMTFDSPGNRVGHDVTLLIQPQFISFVFDRERARIWLLAWTELMASLVELSVSGDLISHVKTTTIAGKHNDVELLDDGRLLLVSREGAVFIVDDGTFTPMPPIPVAPGEEVHRIHPTGDPATPWFASSTSRLFVFHASGSWDEFKPPAEWLHTLPVEKLFRGNGLIHTRNPEGELELWAAGSSSVLIRKVGDRPWAKYDLSLPPRFSGCASGGSVYPNLTHVDGFDDLVVDGDDLFVTVRTCSAALQIRRTSTCVALASLDEQAAVLLTSDLQALAIQGDMIVLAGEEGLLYRGTLLRR